MGLGDMECAGGKGEGGGVWRRKVGMGVGVG